MMRNTLRTVFGLLAFAAILLVGAACGGGGSDGPTAPTANPIVEVEFRSLQLANSARSDGNVQPQLNHNDALARVARQHSQAMRDQGFFGHIGPDGDVAARLRKAGIQFSTVGENLARMEGVPDPAGRAHSEFMGSPEHRRVMLDSRFRQAGVGVVRSGNTYWLTQVYIRP